MSAARFPAWSSPNFFQTPRGKASHGRFCWNQECQYCRVSCQLPDDDEPREMLSCKFIVMAGMEITELSQELKWCLRAKLPSDAPVSQ